MSDFCTFVLDQLPPPPGRVLEVGCGREGGTSATLAAAGYAVLGVDPEAPEGPGFTRARFQDVEGTYDAVVAGRVLHHVNPLDEGIAKLASLAPLLVVDEFAPDRIDPGARDWYEGQYRMLAAAGADPPGPPDLGAWAERHPDLHSPETLLEALRAHYDERALEWLPYLHRWLGGPSSEALESTLVGAGAIRAIGYRWVGTVKSGSATPARR
ncbi:MAG TPA: methyltransferase domain-containing protein [Gaiellaceae bacterium]